MHTIYDNFVLENKIEDLLTTAIDMNQYATQDTSLVEAPGMKKIIHTYTSTGDVEELAMGEGNTDEIEVSFSSAEYEVGTTQGKFAYYDEQEMTDPMVVDAGLQGLAQRMTNDLTDKVIAELDKAVIQAASEWDYDSIVDAVAQYPYEDETGLFLLINPAQKAELRKNLQDDLKYVEDNARTGYIGTVCGVPVVVSKAVPEGIGYLATREAVTIFVKKGSEIEQERDADHRKNSVFARKVMLVALTDATRAIKLGAEAGDSEVTTGTKATKTIAGTAPKGATVMIYVNGEYVGKATADADGDFTFTAEDNLVAGDKIKVVVKEAGHIDGESAEFTVAE